MKYIILLTLTLGLFSCKGTKDIPPTGNAEETPQGTTTTTIVETPTADTLEQALSVNETFKPFETGDAYRIMNAKIYGKQLRLIVSYGGGCEEHEFDLRFNNAYMEQDEAPTQINLDLFHNANEDRCRSMVTKELRFDLSALQRSGYTKIKIVLTHWEGELWYDSY